MNDPDHRLHPVLVCLLALFLAISANAQVLRESPHADIKIACDICHNPEGWKVNPAEVKFDHAATAFPLEGRHKSASCRECHVSLTFKEAAKECASCHQEPHSGQFGAECASCHTPASWENRTQMTIRHASTRFPLAGAHRDVDCLSCHAGGKYVGTSTECIGCHLPEFSSTSTPAHIQAGFSPNCTNCHRLENQSWKGAEFTHPATFPLTGGHTGVNCTECHQSGYANTSTTCFSCHAATYNATTNPNHAASNFSHSCEQCHTITDWRPAQFDHNLARFPLTGAHQTVECASCHTGGRYTGTSQDCFTCHQTNYREVSDPNHVAGNYNQNCAVCHTTAGWKPASVNHDVTRFPLLGAHRAVDCASCHTTGYNNTSTACFDCHRTAFETVTDPSHVTGSFDHNCTSCHVMDGWTPARFDHNQTQFPLTGAHTVAACVSCHESRFDGTAVDCYSCHRTDFDQVQQPNHLQSQFDHDCLKCHVTVAWKPATFDHQQTNFPLTGGHRAVDCASCHVNGIYTGTATDCYICHRQDFEQVVTPNHAQGQFDHNCTTCHTTDLWKPSTFNHQTTNFPLTGAHRATDCSACHVNGQFSGTATDCYLCHRQDFEQVVLPNHVQAQFDHNCTTCHTTDFWKPSTFNHQTTSFPLVGAHRTADCASCHSTGQFDGLATDCWSCHRTDFESSNNPSHVTLNFNHDCTICHSPNAWGPAKIDHNLTNFPLSGAHRMAKCDQCHVAQRYTGTSTECFACHNPEYADSENPNHAASHFDRNCATCHTTVRWSPAQFDHNLARFQLTGAHRSVDCASCHTGGRFTGTPADCWGCHQQTFTDVQEPNHVQAQFDHNCTICHSTDIWTPATFDHAQTNYPLTGAHRIVDCASCHTNGRFVGTPTDCWGCHQQTFADVQDPNHVQGQFDHNCTGCHNTDGWKPATFNHDQSRFPLTGAHRQADCATCHVNGRFGGTPTDCYTCHTSDFNDVDDPNHVRGQFDHNCTICHTTDAWQPGQYDHSRGAFPLTGAHRQAECATCHVDGRFGGTPTDCYTCHTDDFNGVGDPNHVQAQFDHNCTICHSTDAWEPAQFNHDQADFPLTGAHRQAQCATCHVNGRFDGTPSDCYTCHTNDFNGVQDPNHQQGQFDHNCTICHSTQAWNPAQFDHDQADFPLTGAHRQVQCATCHVNGRFDGTPSDCYTCHTNDFNGVGNPNHRNAQFPHDCTLCHTTNNWDSNFNQQHDQQWFPVYSGSHRGEWANCAECHNNANNYQVFTCITCHEHSNRNEVDREHREVNNYRYESAACYQCHPRGRGDDNNRPMPR